MRIDKIILNDFRAFPGKLDYELKLGGKNLLLYGENGSGKSSIFVALREFFQLSANPKPFDEFRNVFTNENGQPFNSGHVSIGFDDGSKHKWSRMGSRPTASVVREAALRFVALDYRALFEIHGRHTAGRPDLYKLLIENVLRDWPVLVQGRSPTKLGALVDAAYAARPLRHTSNRVKEVKDACALLTLAINSNLPQVITEANNLLQLFGNLGLVCQFHPLKVDYENRRFTGQKLELAVSLYGYTPSEPQYFLNEARLSALALAIHLAAARVSIPSGVPGTPTPDKILVLDDVLIGLDLSNRIPILRLLEQEFADWQIMLITHDRVWFDLAREYTEHTNRWASLRLHEVETVPGQPPRPLLETTQSLLDTAARHLAGGDLMAAAVYVRAAFETRLRNVCKDHGIEIAYKPDPKDVKADKLWEGIVNRQRTRQSNSHPLFIDQTLLNDIETVRSTILNRLSHSGAPTLVKHEVQFAHDTVSKFDRAALKKHP